MTQIDGVKTVRPTMTLPSRRPPIKTKPLEPKPVIPRLARRHRWTFAWLATCGTAEAVSIAYTLVGR